MSVETAIVAGAIVVFVFGFVRPRKKRRRGHSWLYEAYMDSPLWRFRRWLWFYTSRRRCEKCGCRLALHKRGLRYRMGAQVVTVHHKTYKHLGRERRREVSLLCWPCHQRKDAWRFR